ncbi:retinol dehydrogenase 11 isoform X2 [Nilaparvata lugens]|nr:retinol dehydrogenase 11 isoform X2 [Nilaparvata lugens]
MQDNLLTTLWFIIKYIAYEIYYYILGAGAIVEDLINYKQNHFYVTPQYGKVAVVTGGARGLGLEVVKKFLQMDMKVIIGCRNVEAGIGVMQEVRRDISSGEFSVLKLDMMSFESIKKFADKVLEECPQIHILINNAGIMFPPYTETAEGYESQWGVNFMGHCYLTHLLLPRLKRTAEIGLESVRIVNVSSCAHFAADTIKFKEFNRRSWYIPSAAYAQSKLAQVVFTKFLDKQMKNEESLVEVFAVHPGIVDTDIFNGTLLKVLVPWLIKLLFKTPEQGTFPILHAALSKSLVKKGGSYISNCQIARVNKAAENSSLEKALHQYCKDSLAITKFGQVTA